MNVVNTIADARKQVKEWQKEGLSVGFVPTMGFLHEGHGSLMEHARIDNDKVVVSIFVNPTQFGAGEDLDSYPRDLEGDSQLCICKGVDLIFAPTAEEMYPKSAVTSVSMTGLTEELCGKSRPTHFSGVCLVVSKLFHIIPAERAYFGQKDGQQLAIIRRMVEDLSMDIKIIGCPIVREESGLALSSRNSYLSDEEKKAALILSKTLNKVEEVLKNGEKDSKKIKSLVEKMVEEEPLARLDYGEVVDLADLIPVEKIEASVMVALAVFIGKTRLIDNLIYHLEG